MTELGHLIKNWLVADIQKNIRLWPKSRKTIILDLAIGWLMAGISFGVALIMFLFNNDTITKFIGCPLVALWGIGFFVYGMTMANLYLKEFMNHRN